MSDDLLLPQVPEPKPEDPEDVSWALSTAEAMWARGDHSEGVKWVRRAAEAAADAENDARSLELAKAAADLAGLVSKRVSRASIHIDDSELSEDEPAPPPPVPPRATRPPPPKAAVSAPKAPGSVTKQVTTPSRPPAPLPSGRSQPPPAMGIGLGTKSKAPGTGPKSLPPPKLTPQAPGSDKSVEKKGRKSKVNLEAEARAVSGTGAADTDEAPIMRRSRPELGPSDPTFVGNVNDLLKQKAAASFDDDSDKTTDEWDAAATQNLTGDELNNLPFPPPSSMKSAALGTPDFKSTVQAFPKPAAAGKAPAPAPTTAASRSVEPHDPGITTTQAVRVVVWRDGNGVHVAPAGTVVSAITVDAVLVALDANADLTAWLTQKGR